MHGIETGNISTMMKNSAPSVLVVDDEALIRWSLSEALGERGYVVSEAGSGKMAIEAITQAVEPFVLFCSTIGCRIRQT